MTRSVILSDWYKNDLDRLDHSIRRRVPETVRKIQQNPNQPGLGTEKPTAFHTMRTIRRSRVNQHIRILWEALPGGTIALWRIGKHEFIDSFSSLPGIDEGQWEDFEGTRTEQTILEHDWRQDTQQFQPFQKFPENHLILFGVPEDCIEAVRLISNAEEIWDLPLPEHVQYTLYDILLQGSNWTADSFLDSKHLLYRVTVDQLEGYCEGKIKKLLLNLSPEQMEYVRISSKGPILIKGVAGSGKTTIGLYRARYLADTIEDERRMFGEETNVLVLTYTETLAKALNELLLELYGQENRDSVHVYTFRQWMLEQLYPNLPPEDYPIARDRLTIAGRIQQVLREEHPESTLPHRCSTQFLLDEVDQVIRARLIDSLDKYREIVRIGRGKGLDRNVDRPIVWDFFNKYQTELDSQGLVDYADLPRKVLEQRRGKHVPRFDAVIVDEAQDLTPAHLRLALDLVSRRNDRRGLTLLADPAQSIYYRGIPWKEAGLNITGRRTRSLKKNFRNTVQILETAKSVLNKCQALMAENEYIPPSCTDRPGPHPLLIRYEDFSQAVEYIIQEILRLSQLGRYRPGDFAVLARQKDTLTIIKRAFSKANVPYCHFRDEEFRVLENQIKLITMHSAKGLEFPVVFLVDLREGILPHSRVVNEDDVYGLEQERKVLYVSMTRAAERLYMLYPRNGRSRFIHDLDLRTVEELHL